MRLTLTVVDPRRGSTADMVLDAAPESPMGDVARTLQAQLGGRRDTDPPAVYVDGLPVDPDVPLGRSPLREGTVVSLHSPAGCTPREVTGIVELRVAGGPDAGAVHRLGLGRTDIGRGAAAHVRIHDPELPERALTLTVAPDGSRTVRAHAGAPAVLDGVPLARRTDGTTGRDGTVQAAWPLDSQLAIGGTLLELVAYQPPDVVLRPADDGRGLAFERRGRLVSSDSRRGKGLLPRKPRPLWFLRAQQLLFSVAAVSVIALSVVFTILFEQWYLLLVALAGVLYGWLAREAGRQLRARRRRAAEQLEADLGAVLRRRRRRHPSPAAVLSLATGPRAGLWERRPGDPDHLALRVGTGPALGEHGRYRREDLADDLDPEPAPDPYEITDAPVVLSLRDLGVLGLAGPGDSARALARWAVAQIAALHSPLDVAVHVLTLKGAHDSWDWLRWLPHARPLGGTDALVAIGTDAETVGARIGELVRTLEHRRKAGPSGGAVAGHAADIVVVCDGFRQLRSLPDMAYLLREGPAVGIRVLCLDEDPRFLPEECRTIVVTGPREELRPTAVRPPAGAVDGPAGSGTPSEPVLRVLGADKGRPRDIRPDFVSAAWCARLARALAPLRDTVGEAESSTLPVQTRLLDVLALEPPTGKAVAARWSRGPSTLAVIGETYDGPFGIDLRRDGPHALIAGTTGSGKSELLQTIVASLALANSPEHLTFVLVDYRGGAAFMSCASLPHTVGLVTDLDPYLVQRVLASFSAELRRREHLLAGVGAKDIEGYQELVRRGPGAEEPLPRLVIVVDEIASIARELPDFITGLINVAQRGRSLGVHLVLATQRPSGVISAEIRANTNLRMALRVTDGGESHDIVDAPEAAMIPRSTPGRGYARLGHASLIPFQSGRVGGLRPGAAGPAAGRPRATRVTWQQLGRPAPPAPVPQPVPGADAGTDLDALVDAVRDAYATLGVPAPRRPWLPPLPDVLPLDEIAPRTAEEAEETGARPGALRPVAFGLEDLPAEQRRHPVGIDFAHFGHLLIGGAPRSGRSQALRTIAGSLARVHSGADVHLYGIDCGPGGLRGLAALPHCGALVTGREPERAARLLARLTGELRRRQSLLAAGECTSVADQRGRAAAAERLPYLVVLLDGWESWGPTLGEYDFGRLTDELLTLMREGATAGIHLVIAGDRQLFLGRIASLTEDKYALRFTDHDDYQALLGIRPGELPESMPAGRAVRAGAGTEVQFALLADRATPAAQDEALAWIAAQAGPVPPERRPFRVDALPDRVGFDEAWRLGEPERSRARLWTLAGVGGDELTGYGPDLAEGVPAFVIAGPRGSGRSTALLNAARSCIRQGVRLVVAAPRPSPLRELRGQSGVLAVFQGTDIERFAFERTLGAALPDDPVVVLVDDGEILAHCEAGPTLEQLIRDGDERGLALVLAGDEERLCPGFSGWQAEARKARRGLLLSPQTRESGALVGVRLGRHATGDPIRPRRGLLHLGDGSLRSVVIPSK
ncbi:FtsK/SpoIIIE domain-containing protein [Streptomyces sp. Caat 7-52]|uniref:FtsK/SpoIIIE domain-containing protein n=1 Tax=Streptomyces sp. Caat 7-52 TaxID=2949637 RepID=UPI002035800F|nr:FtsK/SpoIIIE domain-containing protein [Streptomyces sp. Caat 7-52]